jgi:hypothetical protein
MVATLTEARPGRHYLLLEALTPVAHGDTSLGVDNGTNARLFMRQGRLVGGVMRPVPAVSENALRSILFRRPLHDHLLTALRIGPGTLPQGVMNLLFSGGAMLGGAKAPAGEIAVGHKVRALYPSLDLLGGAVDGMILPRSRLRLAAWLVAREYLDALALVYPGLHDDAEAVSAYDLLAEETRTRGTGDESAGNQMLYTYETLAAGAQILAELTLDAHTPPRTASAVATALDEWDGYFGGQGRQGRGRLDARIRPALDAGDYLAHLADHGDAMRAGLLDGTLGTGTVLCAR